MSEHISDERLRRWRLLLGQQTRTESADGTGYSLSAQDARLDAALASLYDNAPFAHSKGKGKQKSAGLESSVPAVAAWLSEVRELFPQETIQILQKDVLDKVSLGALLVDPEIAQQIEPDINMAATLIALGDTVPSEAKAMARQIVRKVTEEVSARLAEPLRSAVSGRLNRAQRQHRPRQNEIDWNKTILKNLSTYDPERKTVIPERLVGHSRARRTLKSVTLCMDQSGSMASSVIYAGIFGSVLASLPALQTNVVAYDTSVVDLTDQLSNPVDVLFGIQLGGGTVTSPALQYCAGLIRSPEDHVLVLISDLYDADPTRMVNVLKELRSSGIRVIVLPALDDEGTPSYDKEVAAQIAACDIPVFACTPQYFPDLMAAALGGDDLNIWAASNGFVTARAKS